ncbi:MAG: kelch repeat-containing protein, partial [Myxococcota bacterium]
LAVRSYLTPADALIPIDSVNATEVYLLVADRAGNRSAESAPRVDRGEWIAGFRELEVNPHTLRQTERSGFGPRPPELLSETVGNRNGVLSAGGASASVAARAEDWSLVYGQDFGGPFEPVTPPPSPGPVARGQAAIAYDYLNRQPLIFGGLRAERSNVGGPCPSAEFNGVGDTWLFDGARWNERLSAPPARFDTAAAAFRRFDGSFGVLMTGGRQLTTLTDTDYCDTWEWDGAAWSENTDSSCPFEFLIPDNRALRRHAMVYVDSLQATLLTGGECGTPDTGGGGPPTAFNSCGAGLWYVVDEFGSFWDESLSGQHDFVEGDPQLDVYDHVLTYDPVRDVVVSFGGLRGPDGSREILSELYEYDVQTQTWTLMCDEFDDCGGGGCPCSESPSGRFNSTGFYDPSLGGVVVMGGQTNLPFSMDCSMYGEDAWLWKDGDWRQLFDSSCSFGFPAFECIQVDER